MSTDVPEENFVQLLKEKESIFYPGFARTALFLSSVFIMGGDTTKFFRKLDLQNFDSFSWLFVPKIVVDKTNLEVMQACDEFFNPQGYGLSSSPKWKYNCQLLHSRYNDDVGNLFGLMDNNANKVLKALYYRNRAKTAEKVKAGAFLRYGFKIAQLTVQMLHKYELYKFEEIEKSGFPPDFQAMRIALQTNQITLTKRTNADLIGVRTLVPKLSEVCYEKGINPRDLQETLWSIGTTFCNNENHRCCPIESMCKGIIKSGLYQNTKAFGPEDIIDFRKQK